MVKVTSPRSTTSRSRRSLAALRGRSYDKGRGIVPQVLWVALSATVFMQVWCPSRLRCTILRVFGASVGRGVLIKHDVRIQWPWKLSIGDNSWIGTGAYLHNIEHLTIGSDVCISQQAFLCTGSHDYRSPVFEYDNRPIVVEDGVWVGARAVVLRGVTIGADSVIGATALIVSDVRASTLVLAPQPVQTPLPEHFTR